MKKDNLKTKYLIVLGDGMADHKDADGQTPLMLAKKPFIDRVCKDSELGLVQTVPFGMAPGSDTANLSVMGYDPQVYYTGRSPLEAVSIGVKLNDGDVTFRMNFVTLKPSDSPDDFKSFVMHDYSAGEIETHEATALVEILKPHVPKGFALFVGTSYRHCLVKRGDNKTFGALDLTPPHDISDKPITTHLPQEPFLSFVQKAYNILKNHPDNKTKANGVWIWGQGTKPMLTSFNEKFGFSGAVISEVDLIKGIGICAGMQSIDVDGADGSLHTNYEGMVDATIKAFESNDFVYLHIEAPDEMGHKGDKEGKIKAIEFLNDRVVEPLVNNLSKKYHLRMLFLPDHATPLQLKTHTSEAVPYMLYDSNYSNKQYDLPYTEEAATSTGILENAGHNLIKKLLTPIG